MSVLRSAAMAFALVIASATFVGATTLSIGGNSINWNPGVDGTPSGTISIELFNSDAPDNTPSGRLAGWILTLGIQPVAATGTLEFDGAALPSGALYILNLNSSGLQGSVTNSSVFAYDVDPSGPNFGVTVPASGKYLLDVDFKTPDNATGLFALVALPGIAVTQWTDGAGDDREFANLPWDASNPIVLGFITVVPEPSSLMMVSIGCCTMGTYAWRRRRHRGAVNS